MSGARCIIVGHFFTLLVSVVTGATEPGALRGPEQPDEAAGPLQEVDGPDYGRVLQTGRPGARARHGHQPHVRQEQRHYREKPGTSAPCVIKTALPSKSKVLAHSIWLQMGFEF